MRDAGITLHLCSLKPQVREVLAQGGQLDEIGHDNVHRAKADALHAIYARLDSGTCATCTARVFEECQVTLPDGSPRDRPRPEFALQGR